jgi:hypothetical protein
MLVQSLTRKPLKTPLDYGIRDESRVVAGQVKTFPQNIHVASKLIRVRCVSASVFFLLTD